MTRLGAGLFELSTLDSDADAAAVLHAALDGGITFLDTAACYGDSEEKVGKAVAGRRDSFVLASKCGHQAGDANAGEWTAATITASVEQSLRRLKTDHLDLLQLHSCSKKVLERGEAIEAMEDARRAGKTRYIGYSGDNEAAMWAVHSGRFQTLQTSYNVVEQRARTSGLLQAARTAGMGVIAKRPIANGSFGAAESPLAYADTYFGRARKVLEQGDLPGRPRRPDRAVAGLHPGPAGDRHGHRGHAQSRPHARQHRPDGPGAGPARGAHGRVAPPVRDPGRRLVSANLRVKPSAGLPPHQLLK